MKASDDGQRTLRRNVRELPAPAWFLIGGSFINKFGTFVVPFLVLYLRSRGFTLSRAAVAVSAYGLGEVVAGAVGGYLADRIGRKNAIALSMFLSAGAMLALSRARGYGLVVVLSFAAGLVSEMRRPGGLALLTDLVPQGQRVTVFAVFRVTENLATATGLAVGGILANHAFLWLFYGDAASSFVYGVIALAALPQGHRTARTEERDRGGARSMVADRAFLLFLVATVFLAFVYFQNQTTLPWHVVRRSHLSNADFGFLLALNGLLVVLFELPISSLTMRRPAKQMVALGFLLVGTGFALTSLAHSLPTLALTVVVWTAGEMVAAPVSYAYVADIAPEHMRGRYQGLYGACLGSGAIFGPALGGWLYQQVGEMAFWATCGVLGLVAAGLALAAPARARERAVDRAVAVPDAEPRATLPNA